MLFLATAFALCILASAKVHQIAFDRVDHVTYDAIVVGAGTSGCVVAETLGEAGLHVLLVERGYDTSLLPAESGLATSVIAAPTGMIDESLSEVIFSEGGVPYITGRTMGGMSAVNLGGYAEEDQSYFDMLSNDYGVDFEELEWQKATQYIRNSGILSPSPRTRERFFHDWVVSEKKEAQNHHGKGGSIGGEAPLSYQIEEGHVIRTYTVLNAKTNERKTSCSLLGSPNVDLLTRSSVHAVMFEELGPAHPPKATCVLLNHAGDKDVDSEIKACIRTGGKIILAAGVVNSPAILMRSGVGDSAMLSELGVKSVVHNPDVGVGFHDQVISANTMWPKDEPHLTEDADDYLVPDKSFNSHMGIRKIKCDAGKDCPTITFGELTGGTTFAVFAGLLAEKRSKSPSVSSLFKRVLKSQALQLYQRVRTRLANDLRSFIDLLTFNEQKQTVQEPNSDLDKFTNLVACSKSSVATTVSVSDPKSRGRVTLDKDLAPVLEDIYFSNDQDIEDMVDAVKYVTNHTSTLPVLDRIHDRGGSCLELIETVMTKAMLTSYQRTELYPDTDKQQG
eukprot:GHVN01068574.1.p2 GENE.GHVN01068574.1~~GHVN01068574.1.p2  ORF type:complete len:563 (+),score=62.32 GHVN01068574.1:999-2687(+)